MGVTWTPRTDNTPVFSISSIAVSHRNPRVIYACTGEQMPYSEFEADGVLRSFNGGLAWQLLGSPLRRNLCSDIKVHPTNPYIVLAATLQRYTAARVGPKPAPQNPPSGIFKSYDGGSAWSLKLTGEATDLEIAPNNFQDQYAALGAIKGSPRNGLYRSRDGGESWSQVVPPWNDPTHVGRVELALAPSDPNVLYVSATDDLDLIRKQWGHVRVIGVWKTENAWDVSPAWTRIDLEPGGTGIVCYGSGRSENVRSPLGWSGWGCLGEQRLREQVGASRFGASCGSRTRSSVRSRTARCFYAQTRGLCANAEGASQPGRHRVEQSTPRAADGPNLHGPGHNRQPIH